MEISIGDAIGLIRGNPVIVTRPADSQDSEPCKIEGFA